MKPGGRPGKEKPGKPCGKAPRPRKGKMSCFVAEVCGGDEPAVVGVKYSLLLYLAARLLMKSL